MSYLDKLRDWLGRADKPQVSASIVDEPQRTTRYEPWTYSRFDSSLRDDPDRPGVVWYAPEAQRGAFESAETNRLNEAHWSAARDTPINDDLAFRLPTMRTRSNHEAWNNTTIEGLILQHSIAVAGENGPLLDLQANDESGDAWCELAESVWEDWCEYSDAAGDWSLGTRIKNSWNRSCWTNGEWFDQLIFDNKASTPLQFRLHAIEPQRIYSPFDALADSNVVLGVKRNAMRQAEQYFIGEDFNEFGKGDWYDARNIMHGFDKLEVGQARGVPWCQSGLPTAADVRDYDDQVMDAARSAADMAIIAQTKHPDAEYVETNKCATFRRRRINHIAPGWEVAQMNPNQPGANYKDHRKERMADLGRGRGVPSMHVRLTAEDTTYSGARVDGSMLNESAAHVRSTIYNQRLTKLVRYVLAEAVLAGILPPPPATYKVTFIWPAMPQVDQGKAADAEQTYMKIGTLSYSEACIQGHGRRERCDPDTPTR